MKENGTLRITHDGSITVMKNGGITLGSQGLETILYKELGLNETAYSETINAIVKITVLPKSVEPLVGWFNADE